MGQSGFASACQYVSYRIGDEYRIYNSCINIIFENTILTENWKYTPTRLQQRYFSYTQIMQQNGSNKEVTLELLVTLY